jgi:hypothetical protein
VLVVPAALAVLAVLAVGVLLLLLWCLAPCLGGSSSHAAGEQAVAVAGVCTWQYRRPMASSAGGRRAKAHSRARRHQTPDTSQARDAPGCSGAAAVRLPEGDLRVVARCNVRNLRRRLHWPARGCLHRRAAIPLANNGRRMLKPLSLALSAVPGPPAAATTTRIQPDVVLVGCSPPLGPGGLLHPGLQCARRAPGPTPRPPHPHQSGS